MASLDKMLKRATANYIHKIDNILKTKTGPTKTEKLVELKADIDNTYDGKIGFETLKAGGLLVVGLITVAAATAAAAPLIPAILGVSALIGAFHFAGKADKVLSCHRRLDDKIKLEVTQQIDSEQTAPTSLQALQNKTLREQFKPKAANANERFEELRVAVKPTLPKQKVSL